MNRLVIILRPVVQYLKNKYDKQALQSIVKYGLIAVIVLFILMKMSGTIIWMTLGLLFVFIAAKLYQNVIRPLIDEAIEEDADK